MAVSTVRPITRQLSKKVSISSTMGVGIRIDQATVAGGSAAAEA